MAKAQPGSMEVHTKRLAVYSIVGISIPLVSVVISSAIEWAGPESFLGRPSYSKECRVDENVYMTYLGIPNMVLSAASLLLLSHGCYCLWRAKKLSGPIRRNGNHSRGQNL